MKKIRPNIEDTVDPEDLGDAKPHFSDYVTVYVLWLLALILPGLHHFYLGNTWRGLKYLCTFNEVYAGWVLDLFELHVLLQQSVQVYGHVRAPFWCSCCNMFWYIWCCCGCFGCCCGGCKCCKCCKKQPPPSDDEDDQIQQTLENVV